jgi:hypothetical protein
VELLVIIAWLTCGAFTAYVASQRGANGCLWLLLGFLFGPLALIAAFASGGGPRSTEQPEAVVQKKCPDCAEVVRAEARKCRFCGHEFPEPVLEEQPTSDEADIAPSDGSEVNDPGENRRGEWKSVLLAILVVGLLLATLLWFSRQSGG